MSRLPLPTKMDSAQPLPTGPAWETARRVAAALYPVASHIPGAQGAPPLRMLHAHARFTSRAWTAEELRAPLPWLAPHQQEAMELPPGSPATLLHVLACALGRCTTACELESWRAMVLHTVWCHETTGIAASPQVACVQAWSEAPSSAGEDPGLTPLECVVMQVACSGGPASFVGMEMVVFLLAVSSNTLAALHALQQGAAWQWLVTAQAELPVTTASQCAWRQLQQCVLWRLRHGKEAQGKCHGAYPQAHASCGARVWPEWQVAAAWGQLRPAAWTALMKERGFAAAHLAIRLALPLRTEAVQWAWRALTRLGAARTPGGAALLWRTAERTHWSWATACVMEVVAMGPSAAEAAVPSIEPAASGRKRPCEHVAASETSSQPCWSLPCEDVVAALCASATPGVPSGHPCLTPAGDDSWSVWQAAAAAAAAGHAPWLEAREALQVQAWHAATEDRWGWLYAFLLRHGAIDVVCDALEHTDMRELFQVGAAGQGESVCTGTRLTLREGCVPFLLQATRVAAAAPCDVVLTGDVAHATCSSLGALMHHGEWGAAATSWGNVVMLVKYAPLLIHQPLWFGHGVLAAAARFGRGAASLHAALRVLCGVTEPFHERIMDLLPGQLAWWAWGGPAACAVTRPWPMCKVQSADLAACRGADMDHALACDPKAASPRARGLHALFQWLTRHGQWRVLAFLTEFLLQARSSWVPATPGKPLLTPQWLWPEAPVMFSVHGGPLQRWHMLLDVCTAAAPLIGPAEGAADGGTPLLALRHLLVWLAALRRCRPSPQRWYQYVGGCRHSAPAGSLSTLTEHLMPRLADLACSVRHAPAAEHVLASETYLLLLLFLPKAHAQRAINYVFATHSGTQASGTGSAAAGSTDATRMLRETARHMLQVTKLGVAPDCWCPFVEEETHDDAVDVAVGSAGGGALESRSSDKGSGEEAVVEVAAEAAAEAAV